MKEELSDETKLDLLSEATRSIFEFFNVFFKDKKIPEEYQNGFFANVSVVMLGFYLASFINKEYWEERANMLVSDILIQAGLSDKEIKKSKQGAH